MKITLPEHIGEITLEQFQKFNILRQRTDLNDTEFGKRLIAIFTELKYKEIGNIKRKDYADILAQIVKAVDLDGEFKQTFTMHGEKFGMIPNFDKMSMREWTNLCKWEGDKIENYHRIMAILYRPIASEDKSGNYTLTNYEGTEEYHLKMLDLPMDIVNGVMVFFSLIASELQINIQASTSKEQAKKAQ